MAGMSAGVGGVNSTLAYFQKVSNCGLAWTKSPAKKQQKHEYFNMEECGEKMLRKKLHNENVRLRIILANHWFFTNNWELILTVDQTRRFSSDAGHFVWFVGKLSVKLK